MATFNYVYLKCCSDPTVIVRPCSPTIDGFSGQSFASNTIYFDNNNYCWSAFTSSTVVVETRVNVTQDYFTFGSGAKSCYDCVQIHISNCASLPTPASKCVTWEISQNDLNNATGNSDTSKNGYVYVSYTTCYGEDKLKIYGSRAIEGDCVLDPFTVLIFYYQNNALVFNGLSSAQYLGSECECVCGTCPQCGICAERQYCLDTNNVIPYDGNYSYAGYHNGKFYYTGTTGVIYFDSQKWCLSDTLGGSCVLFGSNPCSSGCPDLCKDELIPGLCTTNVTTLSCLDVDFEAIFNCNVEPTTTTSTTTIPPTTTTTTVFECNMLMIAKINGPKINPTPRVTTTTTTDIPDNCFGGNVVYTLFDGHFQCASTRKLVDCTNGAIYYVSEALAIDGVPIDQNVSFLAIINDVEVCVTYEGPSLSSTNAILNSIIRTMGLGCGDCPIYTPTPTPSPTITPTPTVTRLCPLPTPTPSSTPTRTPIPTKTQSTSPDCVTQAAPQKLAATPTSTIEPVIAFTPLPKPTRVITTPTPTDICVTPTQTPYPTFTPSNTPKATIGCEIPATPTPTVSPTPTVTATQTPKPTQLTFQNIVDCCTGKVVGNWYGQSLHDGVYYFINLNDATSQLAPPSVSLTGCYKLMTTLRRGIRNFYEYTSHIPAIDCSTCLTIYGGNCVTTTTTVFITTTTTTCGVFCNQTAANITFGVNVATSLASGVVGFDGYIKTCNTGPRNSIRGSVPIVQPSTIVFPILTPIIVNGVIYHYTLTVNVAFKILANSLSGKTLRISIGTGSYGNCSYGSYTFTIPVGGLAIDTWFSLMTDISNFTLTSISNQILISIESSTDKNYTLCSNSGVDSCYVFSCSGNTYMPTLTPNPTPTPTPTQPSCLCYTLYNASVTETCEAFYQQCTNTPITSVTIPPLGSVNVCSEITPYQSCSPNLIITNNGNCSNSIICTGNPTPTSTSTPTRTQTPTNTSTPTPTRTQTPTNTSTPTPTRTQTPTITSTSTPTPTRTQTPTTTPTPTRISRSWVLTRCGSTCNMATCGCLNSTSFTAYTIPSVTSIFDPGVILYSNPTLTTPWTGSFSQGGNIYLSSGIGGVAIECAIGDPC